MPSPREIAKRTQSLAPEPAYCGQCGLPNSVCNCGSFKPWGENATNAGSKHTNDPFPGKLKGDGPFAKEK